MATTTSKQPRSLTDFEAANERAREAGRKVAGAYLDGVERYWKGIADLERKLAEQSQIETVTTLLEAQADLTQKLTEATVSTARELVTA
jgi:hypothetical protein